MPATTDRSPERLRVGDVDRDAAVAALGEHYAAGRLNAGEHDERMARAWSARTYGDLLAVFGDLPAPLPAPPGSPPVPALSTGPAEHPAAPRSGWPLSTRTTALLGVCAASIVLVVLVPGTPWPLFVFIWWCVGGFGGHSNRRSRHGHSRAGSRRVSGGVSRRQPSGR